MLKLQDPIGWESTVIDSVTERYQQREICWDELKNSFFTFEGTVAKNDDNIGIKTYHFKFGENKISERDHMLQEFELNADLIVISRRSLDALHD